MALLISFEQNNLLNFELEKETGRAKMNEKKQILKQLESRN